MIRTDIDKALERRERADQWRRESAQRWQEKRRRALVEVNRQGARTTIRRTPLKPVSAKRRVEAAVYRVQRLAFLTERPRCEFPLGCTERSTTVHHLRGRTGDLFLDERWWKASCLDHNAWCEDNPAESDRIGWRLPRVGLVPEDGDAA